MNKTISIKAFIAVAIAGSLLTISLVSAQTAAPTEEQIQQMMQQFGAPTSGDTSGLSGIPEGFGPSPEMMQGIMESLKAGAKNMQKGIAQMKKAIAGAEKAGFTVASEIIDGTSRAEAAVQTIASAEEFNDDVQAAIDEFNTFMENILEKNIEPLNMLAHFSRIKKQADREIVNLTKAFEKTKVRLSKTEYDLTENFAQIQTLVDALKSAYEQAIAKANEGDAQEAFRLFEEDFFPGIGNARQSIGMLDALRNLSRAVTSIGRGIKGAEKIVGKLKNKDIDTVVLEGIIEQSKAKLEELKAALAVPAEEFDPDVAVDIIEQLNVLREAFTDTLDGLVENVDIGRLKPVKFFNGVMPKIPKEFQMGGNGGFEKIDIGF